MATFLNPTTTRYKILRSSVIEAIKDQNRTLIELDELRSLLKLPKKTIEDVLVTMVRYKDGVEFTRTSEDKKAIMLL